MQTSVISQFWDRHLHNEWLTLEIERLLVWGPPAQRKTGSTLLSSKWYDVTKPLPKVLSQHGRLTPKTITTCHNSLTQKQTTIASLSLASQLPQNC
jgi:hypothetical protein